ncbi:site-specific DNA-methyltransferase [Skermanella sp. TT6]|uniref:Methyltransferase n=2 Tax=Skermanella cutis TaxID=2775420 RepID=A0ABX7B577_9PROT|nr:site-specific DNA-methyltransferase [Skermanella sp. TT6]
MSFMGKKWDYDVPSVAIWQECLRVLKPGGHLLSFSGTRTYHRLVVNVEDAGFDIRDQIGWLYGSGFPKSHNLKDEWAGWGTALKPAWEPCVLARKPFGGTVAKNVATHGTGAINIDECRVPTEDNTTRFCNAGTGNHKNWRTGNHAGVHGGHASGRWPANVIHDGSDEVLGAFSVFGDQSGTPARFFYNAKASKQDRAGSEHPTVKPVALMQYLVKLVTPVGGTVLDPFAGSGTTGEAAVEAGMNVILIEREAEYVEDISRRLMSSVAD